MTSCRGAGPRSAGEVRLEILSAAAALTDLGVQPGDRVPSSLNSTRYLALDAAIGLVGAVSVPLYYTSLPAEVDHILSSSGGRLLLVGAPKIMARLCESQADLPVVSFAVSSTHRPGTGGDLLGGVPGPGIWTSGGQDAHPRPGAG